MNVAIRRIAVVIVVVVLLGAALAGWLIGTESGLHAVFAQVRSRLPYTLEYDRLQGRLLDGVEITGLRATGQDWRIAIARLRLRWDFPVRRALDIDTAVVDGLDIEWPRTSTSRPGALSAFPVPLHVRSLIVNGPLDWNDAPLPLRPQRIEAELAIAGNTIDITALTLQADAASAAVAGTVNRTSDGLAYTLRGNAGFTQAGIGPLRAQFTINGVDRRIVIEQGQVQPDSGGLIDVGGELNFDGDATQFDLDLQWQDLDLQRTGIEGLRSRRGTAHLEGTQTAYRIVAQAEIDGDALPPATIDITGSGIPGQIDLSALAVEVLDADVSGQGVVRWQDGLVATGTLQGSGVNPGVFWPQWPGNFSFTADGELQVTDGAPLVALKTLTADGSLRDRPLAVRAAGVIFGNAAPGFEDLELRSGRATLSAHGNHRSAAGLEWKIDAPDLGDLWPGATGSLQGSGGLLGAADTTVTFDLTGDSIALAGRTLQHVTATGRIGTGTAPYEAHIKAIGLDTGRVVADHIDVDIGGSAQQHDIRLAVGNERGTATAMLQGGYAGRIWTGSVTALDLQRTDTAPWQLAAPVPVVLSPSAQEIGQTCLSHAAAARACFSAKRVQTAEWQFAGSLAAFPLDEVAIWLAPRGVLVTGQLAADFSGSGTGRRADRFELHARSAPVLVKLPIDADLAPEITIEAVQFDAQYADRRLMVDALATAPAHAGQPLQLKLVLTEFDPLALQPATTLIEGSATAQWQDLSLLGMLVTEVSEPRGSLTMDLGVTGTLATPRLHGEFGLKDAGFELPTAGSRIEDLDLIASGDPAGALRLQGSAASGGGRIEFAGNLAWQQSVPRIDGKLTGTNFEIARTTGLQVTVSPDLTLTVADRKIALTGSVMVPTALIEPLAIDGSERLSEDVVIVGAAPPPTVRQRWPLSLDVQVDLGDDVHARSRLFDLAVTGGVRVTQSAGRPVQGRGLLRLNGDVRAYGTRLKVSNGRVNYEGGSLDDATLDARASRVVDDVTAGIRITGPARAPVLALYSTPTMSQDRILSYLVLGRPIDDLGGRDSSTLLSAAASLGIRNSELLTGSIARKFTLDELSLQGGADMRATSLVIGKYLRPKLYLSYGIGLFDNVGTARLRYDISKRWSVRAEQGSETAVDLLWRIEK